MLSCYKVQPNDMPKIEGKNSNKKIFDPLKLVRDLKYIQFSNLSLKIIVPESIFRFYFVAFNLAYINIWVHISINTWNSKI